MRSMMVSLAAGSVLSVCAAAAFAEPVSVDGVHLCCGACAKAVTAALTGVEGVSNVTVDKDAGTVKYDAADKKGARAGVRALAKAGFAGTVKFEGQNLPFPKGVEAEAKADSVTINGVHNCCDGCVDAISGALKGVAGVTEVKCEKKTCTVTGTGVSHTALIEALHAAGLHGTIGGAKPKAEPKPETN